MKVKTSDVKWPKTLFDDTEPRQPGTHLSDITRDLFMSMNLIPKKGASGFTDMELTAEIGLLWEDVLSKVMKEKYATKPKQISKDGVWLALDGISDDPEGEVPLVVEEYKATWKSVRRCPSEDFKYMTQVKSYCHAIETTVAIMRIFYIMGDYKGSGPVYRVSRIVFTEQELRMNWDMVLRHKKELGI